jgi:branched-chain amino acid transport system substrate-binding protein
MRKHPWLILVLLMFLVLTACQSTPTMDILTTEERPTPSPSQPEPATPFPTTVPQPNNSRKSIALFEALDTDRGKEALKWARMAVEDFNAVSSMQVTLLEVDTGASPATASTAVSELTGNHDVLAVVGLGSAGEAMSSLPILDMTALPVITTSGYAPLTQQGHQSLFRFAPIDDGQGSVAGRFIVEVLNASRVYLLSLRSNSGPYYEILNTSFEQAVSAGGGVIVGRNEITDSTDLASLASEIQSAGADMVFMGTGSPDQVLELAKALQGLASIVAHYDAADSTLLGIDGIYVISRVPAIPSELAQRALDQQGGYHTDGVLVYTAMRAALEAIQSAFESGNPDSRAVRDELARMNQQSDLLGIPITFDTTGDLEDAQFYVLKVENGVFKTITP